MNSRSAIHFSNWAVNFMKLNGEKLTAIFIDNWFDFSASIHDSKSLFSIKLPLISKDLLLIFGVSFSVCFYQFLQGILLTKGEELLFNNEVLVLFNGESINTASAGSLINFIPTSVILFLIWLRYRYVKM